MGGCCLKIRRPIGAETMPETECPFGRNINMKSPHHRTGTGSMQPMQPRNHHATAGASTISWTQQLARGSTRCLTRATTAKLLITLEKLCK